MDQSSIRERDWLWAEVLEAREVLLSMGHPRALVMELVPAPVNPRIMSNVNVREM